MKVRGRSEIKCQRHMYGRGRVRPYLRRGSGGEWKEKENLEVSEAAKVLRYVRVYEKENKGEETEKGKWYGRPMVHTME